MYPVFLTKSGFRNCLFLCAGKRVSAFATSATPSSSLLAPLKRYYTSDDSKSNGEGGDGGGGGADVSGGGDVVENIDGIKLPPEPTTCCMSGCANCVWIQYAESIAKLMDGNTERVRDLVLQKIEDPNLKMFLSIELKSIQYRMDMDRKSDTNELSTSSSTSATTSDSDNATKS
ncbi:oxidoreductase-like domain-containing protein 1 [Musca domestica]|uniref:Oxidoreductase-like domain-containing protein 1 n=1 Tax=Musca domestica TaxID=7370 RepID=A0A9J7DH56_MUSDO|nr:oxidoreductase-like domain-containing protein 1 [Musca domestica]XP_058977041.1 oxidoreductase-like domain-containing protein 1 [Musca domestica]